MTKKAARVHLVLLATAGVIAVIGLSKNRSAEGDSEGAERTGGAAVSPHRTREIPEDDISKLPPRSPRHAAGEFQKNKQMRLEKDRQDLETRLSMLRTLEGDQLYAFASGIELPDNQVRIDFPQLLESRRKIEALRLAGLGAKHPTMEAETGKMDELAVELAAGVASLRAITAAQMDLASDRLKRLSQGREISD